MKGAKALPPRSLAVLRELFQWREDLARRQDKAAFRILNNEPMLFMAKDPPRDLPALKAVRGIGTDQLERRGKEMLAAVQRGLAVPDADLPRLERPPRRQPDAAYEGRLERLKTARNLLAVRYNLAPGVLCPNGTLEAIARVNPHTTEEMSAIPELRRWQLREFGPELLQAVQQAALADLLEPQESSDPRVHFLRRPVWIPHQLHFDRPNTFHIAHHALDVIDNFGARGAAGRCQSHLDANVTLLVGLDIVDQADVDDVQVELGILDGPDCLADGVGRGMGDSVLRQNGRFVVQLKDNEFSPSASGDELLLAAMRDQTDSGIRQLGPH